MRLKKSTPTKEELLQKDEVRAKVAEHAYFISQSEGFPHGRDIVHWLQAEEHVLKVYFQNAGQKVAEAGKKLLARGKGNGKPAPTAQAVVSQPAKPAAKAAPKTAAKTAPKAAPAKKAPAKAAAKKKA